MYKREVVTFVLISSVRWCCNRACGVSSARKRSTECAHHVWFHVQQGGKQVCAGRKVMGMRRRHFRATFLPGYIFRCVFDRAANGTGGGGGSTKGQGGVDQCAADLLIATFCHASGPRLNGSQHSPCSQRCAKYYQCEVDMQRCVCVGSCACCSLQVRIQLASSGHLLGMNFCGHDCMPPAAARSLNM